MKIFYRTWDILGLFKQIYKIRKQKGTNTGKFQRHIGFISRIFETKHNKYFKLLKEQKKRRNVVIR